MWRIVSSARRWAARVSACGPGLGLPQFALDRWRQALETVFHYVVVSARAHGVHCKLLADVSGHDDHRQVERGISYLLQGFRGTESGHLVVGYYQIPIVFLQRGAHGFGRLHAPAVSTRW
jgi:hypothetical protein